MRAEYLDTLDARAVAFDTETYLVQAKSVPKLVCASMATVEHGGKLLSPDDARKVFRRSMQAGIVLVGASIAFDCAVMVAHEGRCGGDAWNLLREVFAKYRRGEIFDVQGAEMLHAIAEGTLGNDPRTGKQLRSPTTNKIAHYSLECVLDLVTGRVDAKKRDRWRMRYAILDGISLDLWPTDARQYPIDDAVNTLECALAQAGLAERRDGRYRARNAHAIESVARDAWVLHLGALWGFDVDHALVDQLRIEVAQTIEDGRPEFQALGWVRADGSRCKSEISKAVAVAYGGALESCPHCGPNAGLPDDIEEKAVDKALKRLDAGLPWGKQVSPKTGNPVTCKPCSGTSVNVAAVPHMPLSEKGGISTKRDVLIESGDENLYSFGEWGESDKVLSTYIPALLAGVPIRPNVPLANERVSYRGIVQTMPRGGRVRECIVARSERVFSSVDFASVELATLAQVCLWKVGGSRLAPVINAGKDPHSVLGANMVGVTYEAFVPHKKGKWADYRQASKWVNFGLPGGMGEVRFVTQLRSAPGMTTVSKVTGREYKGVRLCLLVGGQAACGVEMAREWRGKPIAPLCAACLREATAAKKVWLASWPYVSRYLKLVGEEMDAGDEITHFGSGIVRGGLSYCAAANGYFSAMNAVGAKRALWAVAEECYTDRESVLWGSRPIAFIHDEIVTEHPEPVAAEAAERVSEIMNTVMQEVVPDVVIRSEPALMRRLYKGAEPVYVVREGDRHRFAERGDPGAHLTSWDPLAEKAQKVLRSPEKRDEALAMLAQTSGAHAEAVLAESA